jgi:hypothetical protein
VRNFIHGESTLPELVLYQGHGYFSAFRRRLKQLGLAIEPVCSSLEPSGHRGTHCRDAVDALGSSVRWLVIPVD